MLRSMTGFASKTIVISPAGGENIQITISIKSLNARFFETSFKMPHIISSIEVPLIKKLKKELLRGNIYFTLYISDTSPFKGEVEPAINVCKSYAQAIEKIKQHVPVSGDLSVSDLIDLPHIFTMQEKELDASTKDQLFATIDEVVASLIAEQEKEGIALQNDLVERIAIMQKAIELVDTRTQEQVAEYKEKIAKEMPQESEEEAASDTRKNTLYIMLDKVDVHEEIVRFKSHLKNLNDLIQSPKIEKGKRIDFTLQELSREINTIAAKASDADISAQAVNVKVELEKAREQTQNIV